MVPLRLSTYFGLIISVITLISIIGYTSAKLIFRSQWPAGFATLAALSLASISINAMLLGIIGEYLGRMYQQLKKQPLTIIEDVAGVAEGDNLSLTSTVTNSLSGN
ncbi:hypothetical protein RBB78_20920 [Tunturiibacter empetritectus]|uniref:hypothetical protein n=1 Tax=Tunturiibacter empetritectus TaxID=3069691 RepID=UPI003D9B429A